MTEVPVRDSAATFTFLFTDLEGSTRLWEKFPDAMKGALRRHDLLLGSAIEAAGGRVVKSTGDGLMAVFANPADGAAASLAAQQALKAEPWPDTGPLRVRMGLHTGAVEVRGDDYFGPTVNRTARLMAAGHGGQVLFSAATAALATDGLPAGASLADLGEHRLKDLGRPERVFQLVHPDLGRDFPPLVTVSSLAAPPTLAATFIGRAAEIAAIGERLADPAVRLLTLLGPGGTGKTTLAIRAAEEATEFPDGVAFVDLSGARDNDAVLVAIARAIGVGEAGEGPLQAAVIKRLRDLRILLLLDNLEQVTRAAGLVAAILADCPRLKMLATSREALHIRAEHVFPVPPMALPASSDRRVTVKAIEGCEAVRLFVDRASAIRPDFVLTDENAATVAEICHGLDGLPLAIELAAARLRLLSPQALLAQLQDRLKLLRSGPRDLPERQQTLRAAIDWSYELLSDEEKRLFELLAVFDSADVGDVEAVAAEVDQTDAASVDLLDCLASLVEKSLVRRIDDASGSARLAMLQTIRAFAADRLAQNADRTERARRAHAAHYAGLAGCLLGDLNGARRNQGLDAMVADAGNFRAAWRYWIAAGDLEQLEKLSDPLQILNDARGWYADTVAITTDLLAVLGKDETPERAGLEITLRTSLARALMTTKGFTPEVEEAYSGAIDLFERGVEGSKQYPVLYGLSRLYALRAEGEKALRLGGEILALGEREKSLRMQIEGHLSIGTTMVFATDVEAGLAHLDTAIALFPKLPDHAFRGVSTADPRVPCYTTSGFALFFLGFPDSALQRADSAIALAEEIGHPFTTAYANFHAGLLHFWRREPELAVARATRVLEVADEYDFKIWTAVGTCLLGAARSAAGDAEDGLATLRGGLDQYRSLHSPPVFWPMLLSMDAAACGRAGKAADGLPSIEAAIRMLSVPPGAVVLADVLIIKGDLIAILPGVGEGGNAAEALYRKALDDAAGRKVRLPQLRAATRLARLVPAGPEGEAARDALATVYATFTEGFATRDLAEARDLLAAAAPARS
jgi:predicted ATPase/class 3 adenylate cyclase